MSSAWEPGKIASDEALLEGLRSVLGAPEIVLIERMPNGYESSVPSEIVRVRVDGESPPPLFCKYDAAVSPDLPVHRRGVGYESRVYRDVLMPLGASVPRFFGTWSVPGGSTCMVVEALVDTMPLRKLRQNRMAETATWIGRFHRRATEIIDLPETAFLHRYDRESLRFWMDCAERQAAEHGLSLPWLTPLARMFDDMATDLAGGDQCVVHGEFYPMNILATESSIHPIDWESTGIGPGELDVASLVMGWPDDVIERCLASYAQSRWPEGPPRDLRTRIKAATLYLCLRMLGDNPAPTARSSGPPFFDYLHRTALECGLRDSHA